VRGRTKLFQIDLLQLGDALSKSREKVEFCWLPLKFVVELPKKLAVNHWPLQKSLPASFSTTEAE